jgi:hypothetical protein
MKDIDFKTLAANWSWLIELDDYKLLAVSPFGDLLLRDTSNDIYLLDINSGELLQAEVSSENPETLFPDYFDGCLAHKYRQAQLFLKPGTCYGYKRQTVIGGSYEVENVYIADVRDYVSFMGDFCSQIKDIPDGTKVKIVVK